MKNEVIRQTLFKPNKMSLRKLFLLFISMVTLVACNPKANVVPVSTSMPLLSFQTPNIYTKYWDSAKGLDLDVGIYAINKDEAFLLGSLDRNSALSFLSSESTLLRSDDGGKH